MAYTGTVTAAGSFTVGTLEVDCGQIKQADPATVEDEETPFAGTLTVKTTFDWTGGTLNSNTVAGTIALAPGAMGIAAPSFTNPGINGTVYLGSTFELQGTTPTPPLPSLGSVLDVMKGTFMVLGGDGFVVNENARINFNAEPTPTGKIKVDGEARPNPSPLVRVKPKGTAEVYSVNHTAETIAAGQKGLVEIDGKGDEVAGSFFINRGTTTIHDRTELRLVSSNDTANYIQSGGAQGDPDPVTTLQEGSRITCTGTDAVTGGVTIKKGRFEVVSLTEGGARVSGLTAVVSAPQSTAYTLNLEDGTVLTMPDVAFCTLSVDGKFRSAGEIRLAVNPSDSSKNDQITVTKDSVVNTPTSKLTLRWSAVPTAARTWELIYSEDKKGSSVPAGNFTGPALPANATLVLQLTGSTNYLNAVFTP